MDTAVCGLLQGDSKGQSLICTAVGGWEAKGPDPSALDGFYGYGAWRRVGIALIRKLDTQSHCVLLNSDSPQHPQLLRRILG